MLWVCHHHNTVCVTKKHEAAIVKKIYIYIHFESLEFLLPCQVILSKGELIQAGGGQAWDREGES